MLLVMLATPAAAHSGVVVARTMPELSDVALVIVAALGIWFVRRAMRRRFRDRARRKD